MTRTIGEVLYAEVQDDLRVGINHESDCKGAGWFIFETFGSENSDFQLQKDEESDKFDSDEQVWEHVRLMAAAFPDGLEARALAWIERNDRREYGYIMARKTPPADGQTKETTE